MPCPQLIDPIGGHWSLSNTAQGYTSGSASLSCADAYTGGGTIYCVYNSENVTQSVWATSGGTPNFPVCNPRFCSQRSDNHGLWTPSSPAVGATSVLTCNPGYIASTPEQIQCLPSLIPGVGVQWSLDNVYCVPLACPALHVANGYWTYNDGSDTSNSYVYQTATLHCLTGYTMIGYSASVECLFSPNGTSVAWAFTNTPPICTPQRCSDLGNPTFGTFTKNIYNGQQTFLTCFPVRFKQHSHCRCMLDMCCSVSSPVLFGVCAGLCGERQEYLYLFR